MQSVTFVPKTGKVVLHPIEFLKEDRGNGIPANKVLWLQRGHRIYRFDPAKRIQQHVAWGVLLATTPDGHAVYSRWGMMGPYILANSAGIRVKTVRGPFYPIEKLVWSPDKKWLLFSYRTHPVYSFSFSAYGLGLIRVRDGKRFLIVPGDLDHIKFSGILDSESIEWLAVE